MRILYYLLLLVVIFMGSTFAALNLQTVSVNYYVAARTMPLALLLVFTFAAGCIIGLLIGFWLLIKVKLKYFRVSQRLVLVEKELENLRTLPLRNTV